MNILSLANDIVLIVKGPSDIQAIDIIRTAILLEKASDIIDDLPSIVSRIYQIVYPAQAANLPSGVPDELMSESLRLVRGILHGEYGHLETEPR